MRQIILDTETTGLDPAQGHRIIEVGCVELLNRRPTGNNFHHYIHPDRDIDEAAIEIHGITLDQLKDKPKFGELAEELLTYLKGAELVIHNAPFDVAFLDHEFEWAGLGKEVVGNHCEVLDTLAIARHKHPGQKNSLDALCRRYDVDNSQRDFHGALLDAEILADVYLSMTGGQVSLLGESDDLTQIGRMKSRRREAERLAQNGDSNAVARELPDENRVGEVQPTPLVMANEQELAEHARWLELLEKEAPGRVIWHRLEADDGVRE